MTMDNPPEISRLRKAQNVGNPLRFGFCGEQALDSLHRTCELLLPAWRQTAQHFGDLPVRSVIQLCEHSAPLGGKAEDALSTVGSGGRALDPMPCFEGAQDTAEISGIEAEVPRQ